MHAVSFSPSTQEGLALWRPRLIRLATASDDNDGAHDLNHLERVWSSARGILASLPRADALVVMAACYLHDLVNLPKNHPERSSASRMSAQAAVARLSALDFPADRLAAVAHAIEAHSYSAGIAPETVEAKIVQDADRIDALGAVGLARMFHVGGQLGRALAHSADPLALRRDADDGRYTLDHIACKLLRLPATMQTEAGRALAEERARWVMAFRDQFAAEWGGDDRAPD
ncbi:hydrolase [Bordetella genomosp. 10]|uniref:Hydrolase n=1 Tax=Bordetella genomosp. 10 TaxID=1416804 RepID=A0A261SBL9_9BORD|nr:HD domain-containing protein [Bordetella genomosp. 10]OZI34555.1 hydrolase [Bordetella genomosp. 10]